MRVLTAFVLTIFLFYSFVSFAEDENTNFSGRWVLNSDKTLVRGQRTNAQGELNIKQNEEKLSIGRISFKPQKGRVTTTRVFTLDEEISENIVSGRLTKSQLKWSSGGKSLTIYSTSILEREEYKMQNTTTETLKLSSDGKTLFVDYTSRSSTGSRTAHYVYDKK